MRQVTQVMSEQIRTKKKWKPNRENPVTSHRRQVDRKMWDEVANRGIKLEQAALEIVRQHEPQIRRYVSRRGETPLNNPVELSVQAAGLAGMEAARVAKDLGVSIQDAQIFLDENESSHYEMNASETDEFLGSILGAIGAVANKGIQKIADKKQSKGKPAKFWTWLADLTKPAQPAPYDYGMNNPNIGEGIKIGIGDVLNDIKNRERKKEIDKMMPLLIGGALVLILVTVLISKNAK